MAIHSRAYGEVCASLVALVNALGWGPGKEKTALSDCHSRPFQQQRLLMMCKSCGSPADCSQTALGPHRRRQQPHDTLYTFRNCQPRESQHCFCCYHSTRCAGIIASPVSTNRLTSHPVVPCTCGSREGGPVDTLFYIVPCLAHESQAHVTNRTLCIPTFLLKRSLATSHSHPSLSRLLLQPDSAALSGNSRPPPTFSPTPQIVLFHLPVIKKRKWTASSKQPRGVSRKSAVSRRDETPSPQTHNPRVCSHAAMDKIPSVVSTVGFGEGVKKKKKET